MARQSKAQRILTHSQVWTALDRLAERAGMSPSGLAKRSGPRPHHLQQIQAHHRRRPRALAFDRIGFQGAGRDQFVDRHLCAVDRRRRAQPAIGAAARAGASRQRRPFRRERLSRRPWLGRGGAATGLRRARLCAGDLGRFDEARLSRRRHHRGVAGNADPARRPRGAQDVGRRSDGQGIEAPHHQDAGTGRRSTRPRPTARSTPTTSPGSQGSCGRASRIAAP